MLPTLPTTTPHDMAPFCCRAGPSTGQALRPPPSLTAHTSCYPTSLPHLLPWILHAGAHALPRRTRTWKTPPRSLRCTRTSCPSFLVAHAHVMHLHLHTSCSACTALTRTLPQHGPRAWPCPTQDAFPPLHAHPMPTTPLGWSASTTLHTHTWLDRRCSPPTARMPGHLHCLCLVDMVRPLYSSIHSLGLAAAYCAVMTLAFLRSNGMPLVPLSHHCRTVLCTFSTANAAPCLACPRMAYLFTLSPHPRLRWRLPLYGSNACLPTFSIYHLYLPVFPRLRYAATHTVSGRHHSLRFCLLYILPCPLAFAHLTHTRTLPPCLPATTPRATSARLLPAAHYSSPLRRTPHLDRACAPLRTAFYTTLSLHCLGYAARLVCALTTTACLPLTCPAHLLPHPTLRDATGPSMPLTTCLCYTPLLLPHPLAIPYPSLLPTST